MSLVLTHNLLNLSGVVGEKGVCVINGCTFYKTQVKHLRDEFKAYPNLEVIKE